MLEPSDELISRADYARLRGVSPAAVTKRLRAEDMAPALEGKLVRWRLANRIWSEGRTRARSAPSSLEAREQGPATSPDPNGGGGGRPLTLEAARRAEILLRTEKLAIEVGQMRGELVSARGVETAVSTALRIVRDRLMSLPVRSVGLVREAEDERAAVLVLVQEIREVLSGLSGDVARELAKAMGQDVPDDA